MPLSMLLAPAVLSLVGTRPLPTPDLPRPGHCLLAPTRHYLCALLDAHALPVAAPTLERHVSVFKSEESVVPAPADVGARMEVGAPLPHDDLTGAHALAAEPSVRPRRRAGRDRSGWRGSHAGEGDLIRRQSLSNQTGPATAGLFPETAAIPCFCCRGARGSCRNSREPV